MVQGPSRATYTFFQKHQAGRAWCGMGKHDQRRRIEFATDAFK